MPIPGPRTNTGRNLNQEWGVGARHALYHYYGKFYMALRQFPGAYFDRNGYVLFETEEEYNRSPHLRFGQRVNVPGTISTMPGYRRLCP